MQLETKVCILGAGPGGTTTSLFLNKLGINHIILDKATFPRDKICGDACSGKVVDTLSKIDSNYASEVLKEHFQIDSWGVAFIAPNGKKLRAPFKVQYSEEDSPPGFIAKRFDFDNYLFEKLKNKSYINIVEGFDAYNFEKNFNGSWLIKDKTGEKCITTNLIIAADGAQSVFAKKIAEHQLESKHYAAGIRAYYKGVTELDEENFIELHFIKDFLPGYLWIFPLPNGWSNVGIGLRSDYVSKKKINLKKELPRIIESVPSLKERFKDAELMGKISGFGLPLGSKQRSLSGDGYLLIGDAGSLIDPFTGEGIGNAMISGMIAAQHAKTALESNSLDATFLKTYDDLVYKRLGSELKLSHRMQQLCRFPWLFNFIVNKANSNKTLQETISCMFMDLEIREQLKKPSFYFKLLFD